MSKVLFSLMFGLAVCVPLATTASAQSRLGPAEDDTPVVNSRPVKSEIKSEAKRDAAKGETKEIKLDAYAGGSNFAYVDGHAKFGKWGALWWRDLPNGIYAGSFDPRNAGRSN